MTDDRRLAQSTAAWGGDADAATPADAPPLGGVLSPLAEAATVDQRGGRSAPTPALAADQRYQLLGELGRGGMAVVHAALDRQLGRRVALKLVRPDRVDAAGRGRLLREAQALARLRHTNVVTVYDAGTRGDQVFVAMELIDGGSLTRWLATAARSWRDIVRVFVGAGRGLAAAHAAGLVHRDFKPDNVLVGGDGQPRVADFGLAVPAAGGDEPRDDGAPDALATITRTGLLVGTPAFMAPEQLDGEVATAAADQFAFCVALYRALYGLMPFAGATPTALRVNIGAGALQAPTTGVALPTWLSDAVRRGLAPRPADRHPSMTALVELLGRERGWRRWRGPFVGGVAVVATTAAIGFAATRPEAADPAARCDGAPAELAAVWSPARRAELVAVFDRLGSSLAAAARDRTLGALDDRARAWSVMHRAACVDHARGTQSDVVLDQRMRCLRQRKDDLDAAAAVLAHTDATTIGNAVDVAVRLAPISDCGDLELLASDLPPPPTAAGRAAADALRARLAQVAALDHAGRSDDALIALSPIVDAARQLDDPGTLIAALLLDGKIRLLRGDLELATPVLVEAERRALTVGADRAATEAGARRLYAEGMRGDASPEALAAAAAVLEPLSAGLRGDHFARPLLLNNLGALAMAAGDRGRAATYFAQANAARTDAATDDLELTVIDRNLAMTTDDAATRDRLAEAAHARLRDRLGPAHLSTIMALAARAHFLADPAQALPLMNAALAALRENHPALTVRQAEFARYAAFLAGEVGDAAQELAIYRAMIALPVADGESLAIHRAIAAGQVALAAGDPADAVAQQAAIVHEPCAAPAWRCRLEGIAAVGIARALLAQRKPHDAARYLRAAIGAFDAASLNNDHEYPQRAASARRLLATIADQP